MARAKTKAKDETVLLEATALCNAAVAVSEEDKFAMIEEAATHYSAFLRSLRIDVPNDHNARDTGKRVAKMYVNELCRGRYEPPPVLTSFDNVSAYDDTITVDCEVRSMCAHHNLPIVGRAYIMVLTRKGRPLIGLSKYSRIVDHYARRLQIQEELTRQILAHIQQTMDPEAVGVILDGKHYCRCHRGVRDNGMMRTTAFSDTLRDKPHLAKEFYDYVNARKFVCE